MILKMMAIFAGLTLAAAAEAVTNAASAAEERPAAGRWTAKEVAAAANPADEACLGRPAALAVDSNFVYIADAQDCAVKIFSRDGVFRRSVGRKGRGPGEFSFPSGLTLAAGKILVADKLNFRVQILDAEGRVDGGFAVPFAPDKIIALDGGGLLVTSHPTGRLAGEKLLHLYDAGGRLLWEGLDALVTSDGVYDSFRNMILACPGAGGECFVVFRNGERSILRFRASEGLQDKIRVDERIAFQPLELPFKGPNKRLLGFCWAAAWDRGLFYLLAPEPVDGQDLGPGRRVFVLDAAGRLTAELDLACAAHRFAVDGGRLFAVDDEGGLRIFEVVR